ncbi:MFS transporter [Desulfonema ishimotonii]|nr:MFS transporter [Desulfonema ishimotonii]
MNTLSILMVLAVSLALLMYVGYGEAHKTCPGFQFDKLRALGEVVSNPIRTFLGAGLPLNQFPGFAPLTTPLLESEDSVTAIGLTDQSGHIVFSNSKNREDIPAPEFRPSFFSKKGSGYTVEESDTFYRISLRISSKFEDVGVLWLLCPKHGIDDKIRAGFYPLTGVFAAILILYAVLIFFTGHRWGENTRRWLTISYTFSFMVMSAAVICTLINIYSDGILGKTRALTDSLSQRISKALELGLDISDFSGLDNIFREYRENNPDTSFVALTRNGRIEIHTDQTLRGLPFQHSSDHFEYRADLREKTELPARTGAYTLEYVGRLPEHMIRQENRVEIHVGIPKKLVYSKIWRDAKNFIVLFVASGFMAALFLNLLVSFQLSKAAGDGNSTHEDFRLDMVRPIFFLSIFMEGLNVSFLPRYFQDMAVASGLGTGMASALFTVFFAAYALTLVPACRYAEARGVRKLLMAGSLLAAVGTFLMVPVENYYAMAVIRILCGIGQGMLFIGVQSYILKVASQKKKTQGAAIIVFGYNGGMISGSAIGALLVIELQARGIFILAALIGVFLLWYIRTLIPEVGRRTAPEDAAPAQTALKGRVAACVRVLFRDFNFVKTILLVGITTKATLTGVAIFGIPLLLDAQGYAREDIGQIFMFYAAGVLVTSRIVSRAVDRLGKTEMILFWGTQGSGLGLILIGLTGWAGLADFPVPHLKTAVLISGMLILGLAHGFINAPIVTHIANTPSADRLGAASVTSIYRFLERIGHVAGPVVVSQLLSLNHRSPVTISWIGLAVIIFGLLFIISPSGRISSVPDGVCHR